MLSDPSWSDKPTFCPAKANLMSRPDITLEQLNFWLDYQGLSATPAKRMDTSSRLISEFRAIRRAKQVQHVQVLLRLIDPEKVEILLIKTARTYRDLGYGSSALHLLCLLADRHKVALIADVCPADDFGLGLGDLMEWYSKQSFTKDDEEDECDSWLTRLPKTRRRQVFR